MDAVLWMVIRAFGYFVASLRRFCIDGEGDVAGGGFGYPEVAMHVSACVGVVIEAMRDRGAPVLRERGGVVCGITWIDDDEGVVRCLIAGMADG